ncbi:MAG: hypothetical protein ABIP68_09215 [Ferruginibacter sp.]
MKNIFLLLLLSMCLAVTAQETPATFWKNRCEFKTDGTEKSAGLKIKLSYPCSWTQADGDRPHVVKKFSYSFGKGKSVIQTLMIKKIPPELSKKEIDEMLTQEGLKEIASAIGTFVSGRKSKIDGLDCGEVVINFRYESPVATVNVFIIQYYIPYKDKMINLSFAAGALTEIEAKELFSSYKTLFQGLASNTVILSRWE